MDVANRLKQFSPQIPAGIQISVKLLGPARIATAGLSMITLLGMTKISIISPGGLKGAVKGLWSASPADKKGLHDFQK